MSEVAPDKALRLVTLSGGFEHHCLDLGKMTKREAAFHLMRQDLNTEAIRRVQANPQAFDGLASVYVIGLNGEPRCKIGLSANPAKRMGSLQTALWDSVVCFGLFWAPYNVACGIETRSLRLADKHDVRLRGEWVDLPPDEAVGLILTSMEPSTAFCDSGTFISQWAPPREALYKRGSKFALNLRSQASMDALKAGKSIPDPVGWIYDT